MIQFNNKKDCCGCTACLHACPGNAISMQPDVEGFLYPVIEADRCLECGLCKKVCAFQNPKVPIAKLTPPGVLAMKHNNDHIRDRSQSGGFSYAAAEKVIENKGVVFGAGYGPDLTVCHKAFESKEQLFELQGSKYVQSELGNIFSDIKTLLLKGRQVLFTGTPCQSAGLFAFLREEVNTKNLITLDFVCHGVPSPMLYRDYLQYSAKTNNGKVKSFNFRDKIFGWHSHVESFTVNDRKYHKDIYARLYHSHSIQRPSCFHCPFANLNRASDITMGDFWGIERCMPDFDDHKGVSLVLVNSEKGRVFLESLSSNIILREILSDDYLQPQLRHPTVESPHREKFWNDYRKYGFSFIAKKYDRDRFRNRAKTFIIKIIKKLGLFLPLRKLLVHMDRKKS